MCHTESLCLGKKVHHTESLCLRKKCLSHWVTVFKKKRSKTIKNHQKRSKTVRFWQFLTVFDSFFLNTVTQCDKQFFFKHSYSVWQTFFLLNTVTQCDKHFCQNSVLVLSGKFIFRKNQKTCLPFKNKSQHRRKFGLKYYCYLNVKFVDNFFFTTPSLFVNMSV